MFVNISSIRKGKYKNWDLGRVSRVKKVNDAKYELDINVLEMAYNSQDEEFVAQHMFTVLVKRDRFIEVCKKLSVGDPILFGYYSQSYRSDNDNAYTINSLRAIERIVPEQMDIIAKSVWANKKDPIQVFESEDEINEYFREALGREELLS